ncbi:MAG TPA: DNA-directed RNA polymerase subunit omega [Acidobacteriaceae bacterium]
MRSELVYGATKNLGNRYLLVRAAAQAIRKFHRPNTRIADTANEVLAWFGRANPIVARASIPTVAAYRRRRAA